MSDLIRMHRMKDAIAVVAGGPRSGGAAPSFRPAADAYSRRPRASWQTLVRVTLVSETEFRQEEIEAVRFVPLIGEGGWGEEGWPAEARVSRTPGKALGARSRDRVSSKENRPGIHFSAAAAQPKRYGRAARLRAPHDGSRDEPGDRQPMDQATARNERRVIVTRLAQRVHVHGARPLDVALRRRWLGRRPRSRRAVAVAVAKEKSRFRCDHTDAACNRRTTKSSPTDRTRRGASRSSYA